MNGSWSGFADDLFIRDKISDRTVDTKGHYLDQCAISGRHTGGGSIQAISQQIGDCARHPPIMEAKRAHGALTIREDSVQSQTPGRQIRLQWEQQSRHRVQTAGDGGELVGIARVQVRSVTLKAQTLDFVCLEL